MVNVNYLGHIANPAQREQEARQMKVLRRGQTESSWPRQRVKNVDCRKRDLVIRLTDWLDDKNEPAYDVECYIGGVYDWHESQSFTLHKYHEASKCKQLALAFMQRQTAKLG